MSFPFGVKYLAVVSFIAEPSESGITDCTIPFPYVFSPMIVATPYSFNAAVMISDALALSPFTSTTIGRSNCSSSLITAFIMMKLLKIESKTAVLIGVGSSICGGSAIAATAPVIDADDEDVARSISVIFLFNILAALIFPALGHSIGLGTEGFAVFAGTAVNDTSSVTAAASTAENLYHTSGILSAAVTVKLTRTLAIIPITLALALYRTAKAKKNGKTADGFSFKKIFPWFILYFIAASVITTVVTSLSTNAFSAAYSSYFIPAMKKLAKFFIAMAMGAIGLNTNIVSLVKKGGKPIILGFCCWTVITLVSLAVQYMTGIYSGNIL